MSAASSPRAAWAPPEAPEGDERARCDEEDALGWAPREALASPRAALEKCADIPPRRRARPALLP